MQKRRQLLLALFAWSVIAQTRANAQSKPKRWTIGYLGDGTPAARSAGTFEPFREALRELGYVEGRNITIELRWTEGNAQRREELAKELVSLRCDVIVTHGVSAALTMKRATATIAIVVAVASEMLRTGLVASLARPGGNLTGMTDQVLELAGKQVQLFKEILPKLHRIAIVWESTNPGGVAQAEDLQLAARKFDLQILPFPIQQVADIEIALEAAKAQKADGVILAHTPLLVGQRAMIAKIALEKRLPMMSGPAQFPEAGALMNYGPDLTQYFQRAAVYVDKILKGRKPADLPIEQPTQFDLVVNMKTAAALGIQVPQSILVQATRVIK